MSYKIGVDGGGTKTECILVDDAGVVVEVHAGAGCNPSVVGPDQARSVLTAALNSLRARSEIHIKGLTRTPFSPPAEITGTLLCMSGSRPFWKEFAENLQGFGRVVATDDSVPVLELATNGKPGIVLHAGTGSFVAGRGPDGSHHYAGGLGWRFGDPGSGYDIGRQAIARALLDLQGWQPAPRLSALVCETTNLWEASAISRHFYHEAAANQKIAAFAPAVLQLATEGDEVAQDVVLNSVLDLLDLATTVADKLFPGSQLDTVRAGLSGPILTHPAVAPALIARSPLPLLAVEGTPIEGVRRLLANNAF
jgi:N-acetylglucosamine kinase-like BadF-type ATPase